MDLFWENVTDADGTPIPLADKTGGVLQIFEGETSSEIVLDIDEAWIEEGVTPTELNVELTSITSGDEEVLLGSLTSFKVIGGPTE